MVRTALVALAAAAALAAGCGDDEAGNGGSASSSDEKAMKEKAMKAKEQKAMKAKEAKAMKAKEAAKKGETVKVVDSQFGRILADEKGQAFYLFDKEKSGKSECYGECAEAWPPVLTEGEPQAGSGARAALMGTTKRRDGKLQVTYKGRPMYYYKDDAPGRVLCHNVDEFGGLWLVLRGDGAPVG